MFVLTPVPMENSQGAMMCPFSLCPVGLEQCTVVCEASSCFAADQLASLPRSKACLFASCTLDGIQTPYSCFPCECCCTVSSWDVDRNVVVECVIVCSVVTVCDGCGSVAMLSRACVTSSFRIP